MPEFGQSFRREDRSSSSNKGTKGGWSEVVRPVVKRVRSAAGFIQEHGSYDGYGRGLGCGCHHCRLFGHWKAGMLCFACRRVGHQVRDYPSQAEARGKLDAQAGKTTSGEFYGDPVKSVGVDDQQAMAVRVRLTKDTIKGLVDDKKLFICFQVDSSAEEGDNGSKMTFAEAVSKGSMLLEDSFEFPVLGGSTHAVGKEVGEFGFGSPTTC